MASGSTKAILAAFFANLGIAIAKFVGYLFTSSSSMLAEAIHSLADTSNQALLLLGSRRAARDATPEHPFGFGRERYFWSFIVALVLFTLGGLFAVYEGVHKLGEASHEIFNVQWAIGILVLGIFLEGYSFRTAVKESRKLKGNASWWQFVRHSRTPELPVVLLEDLGALVGLAIALLGVSIATITEDSRWDAYGTIAIGVLLIVIASVLVLEMKSLLIGESALAPVQKKIVSAIEAGEDVNRVLHMRTQHIGPDELLVAAKVQLKRGLDTARVAAAINAAEGRIREALPLSCMIYLEPDIFDPQHPDLRAEARG
ncbi:MAG: cation diffusion facilitator family transporter [Deltaproteobacteria bacterium]|jgi:cation diffusion facilitator family transporter|nr:cation diffusion facilitator family transporter [Deltaproteobacteria bacterium]